MDLSTKAKSNRDQVEDPLFNISKMFTDLEEIEKRITVTIKVYPETSRALSPALERVKQVNEVVGYLKGKLAGLWRDGAARKWQ